MMFEFQKGNTCSREEFNDKLRAIAAKMPELVEFIGLVQETMDQNNDVTVYYDEKKMYIAPKSFVELQGAFQVCQTVVETAKADNIKVKWNPKNVTVLYTLSLSLYCNVLRIDRLVVNQITVLKDAVYGVNTDNTETWTLSCENGKRTVQYRYAGMKESRRYVGQKTLDCRLLSELNGEINLTEPLLKWMAVQYPFAKVLQIEMFDYSIFPNIAWEQVRNCVDKASVLEMLWPDHPTCLDNWPFLVSVYISQNHFFLQNSDVAAMLDIKNVAIIKLYKEWSLCQSKTWITNAVVDWFASQMYPDIEQYEQRQYVNGCIRFKTPLQLFQTDDEIKTVIQTQRIEEIIRDIPTNVFKGRILAPCSVAQNLPVDFEYIQSKKQLKQFIRQHNVAIDISYFYKSTSKRAYRAYDQIGYQKNNKRAWLLYLTGMELGNIITVGFYFEDKYYLGIINKPQRRYFITPERYDKKKEDAQKYFQANIITKIFKKPETVHVYSEFVPF